MRLVGIGRSRARDPGQRRAASRQSERAVEPPDADEVLRPVPEERQAAAMQPADAEADGIRHLAHAGAGRREGEEPGAEWIGAGLGRPSTQPCLQGAPGLRRDLLRQAGAPGPRARRPPARGWCRAPPPRGRRAAAGPSPAENRSATKEVAAGVSCSRARRSGPATTSEEPSQMRSRHASGRMRVTAPAPASRRHRTTPGTADGRSR